MEWIHLSDEEQLNKIIEKSYSKAQVIFKHSTRCSISSVALQRLQKNALPDGFDFYYFDLLAHRPLSNLIARTFKVHHESPQILLIRNGECIFHESHLGISINDILMHAAA